MHVGGGVGLSPHFGHSFSESISLNFLNLLREQITN